MITVHFYDENTGLIGQWKIRVSLSGARLERFIEDNTPAGCKPITGVRDPMAQRVNVETGELIDDVELEASLKGRAASERRRASALADLQALEAKQHRRVREILLATGDERLISIDAEMEKLRAQLSEGEPAEIQPDGVLPSVLAGRKT